MAVGDLDNDGWPDLVISHMNDPVVLLRNDARRSAGTTGWASNWSARTGATWSGPDVMLEAGKRKQTRFAKGGGSYLSARDPRQLFGLATTDRTAKLTVFWPSGRVQQWDDLAVDRYHTLREE